MKRAGFAIFTVVAAAGLAMAVVTVVLWARSHRPVAGSLGITDSIDLCDHEPRYWIVSRKETGSGGYLFRLTVSVRRRTATGRSAD